MIKESELIINADGSAFHLHIRPENLAHNVILVGDPGRVALVSSFFDEISFTAESREFRTATGTYRGMPISCISTGIGTDNIDIVVTELDALVNVDFQTREIKPEHTTLNLVRIGTSGSLQDDLGLGTWLLSEAAIGFDGLLNFYANRRSVSDNDFEEAFKTAVNWNPLLTSPYVVDGCSALIEKLKGNPNVVVGTTISAPGFYGPQGRVVRLPIVDPDINKKISAFRYNGRRITNYEMECSAIYGLSKLLGHNAATICAIIADRRAGRSNPNYKSSIEDLIEFVLTSLAK